jgi:putative transposase
MANKKYKVSLSDSERQQVQKLLKSGTHPARVLTRARALLWAETQTDVEIAEGLDIAKKTVENLRQRYVESGLEAALYERARSGRPPKLTPKDRASITALACSDPPEGYARWSLSLLAERAVALELVEEISRDSVNRILKKTP